MSKILEKLDGMAPSQQRERTLQQTAITRYQLKNLINDMTHYNISVS